MNPRLQVGQESIISGFLLEAGLRNDDDKTVFPGFSSIDSKIAEPTGDYHRGHLIIPQLLLCWLGNFLFFFAVHECVRALNQCIDSSAFLGVIVHD